MSNTLGLIGDISRQIEQLADRLKWLVDNSDIPHETGIFATHVEELMATAEDMADHVRDMDDYGRGNDGDDTTTP